MRQGDLIEAPPLVYYASGEHPIYGLTSAWADQQGKQEGTISASPSARPPFGIITTQTCDLVEENRPGKPWKPKRPWVQVAPVFLFQCTTGVARAIRDDRQYDYFVWISHLAENPIGLWVADLRITVPVEKGWFVGRPTSPGFTTSAEAQAFSDKLARQAARPAYPQALNDHVLRPLRDRLVLLCTEFPSGDGIDEVCLELGHDRDDPQSVRLVFLGETPIPPVIVDAMQRWWDDTLADNQPNEFVVIEPQFTTFDAVTAARYRRLDPVNLTAVSPPG